LDTGDDVRVIALSRQQWDDPHTFTNLQLIHQMRREGRVI